MAETVTQIRVAVRAVVGMDVLFALPFLLGGLAGGFISGKVFGKVSVTLLRRIFGLLIIYGGIRAVLLL